MSSSDEIPGYLNKKIYADIDIERTLVKKDEPKKEKTVMDLKLNEIFENLVNVIADFQKEYSNKVYEIELEYKINEIDGAYNNIKKYIFAFFLYLGDKDNLLYIGILLIIISIILYFFNITILNNDKHADN
tara:strand:- start:109 stop:501 length:393 start_codon:yes stop_codon:yes gene_type:complete